MSSLRGLQGFGEPIDKGINDRFGHPEGDWVLERVAAILRDTFRQADIIARFGGDEFVVLLDAGKEGADVVTRRLRARLDKENEEMDKGYRLDLSVGVVEAQPPHSGDLDRLINQADQAMYLMKGSPAASE